MTESPTNTPWLNRAVITVADRKGVYHVLLDGSGSPLNVAALVVQTLSYVWLSRFEADEWAAAFIAAAKAPSPEVTSESASSRGLVRLTPDWRTHDDLGFRYLISSKRRALWIVALVRKTDGGTQAFESLFDGTLDGFCAFAGIEPGAICPPSQPIAHDSHRSNRFRLAVDIVDPGACNPSGIAYAIIEACRQARDDGQGPARDPAVRLMVTQLAYVCQADSDTDDYGALLAECRARAISPPERPALMGGRS